MNPVCHDVPSSFAVFGLGRPLQGLQSAFLFLFDRRAIFFDFSFISQRPVPHSAIVKCARLPVGRATSSTQRLAKHEAAGAQDWMSLGLPVDAQITNERLVAPLSRPRQARPAWRRHHTASSLDRPAPSAPSPDPRAANHPYKTCRPGPVTRARWRAHLARAPPRPNSIHHHDLLGPVQVAEDHPHQIP